MLCFGESITAYADQSSELKTIALLNINLNTSTLVVIHDHNLIYAHDQSYDGQRLITQLLDYFKSKGANTENTAENTDDAGCMEIFKESLTLHLRHTMHFFYSSRPNIGIQKVVIAGDCAILPNLPQFVQKEIGTEAVVADPFKNLKFASNVNEKDVRQHAPALVLCCGLAMSAPK